MVTRTPAKNQEASVAAHRSVLYTPLQILTGCKPSAAIAMTVTPATPPIPSPCVRNCCLDDRNVCVGCGRTLDEILRWTRLTPAERSVVLTRLREATYSRE